MSYSAARWRPRSRRASVRHRRGGRLLLPLRALGGRRRARSELPAHRKLVAGQVRSDHYCAGRHRLEQHDAKGLPPSDGATNTSAPARREAISSSSTAPSHSMRACETKRLFSCSSRAHAQHPEPGRSGQPLECLQQHTEPLADLMPARRRQSAHRRPRSTEANLCTSTRSGLSRTGARGALRT